MPTFFLRYNPDNFKQLNGRQNKIKDEKRQDVLIKALDNCMNLPPKGEEEFIRIRYLFYNGWIETDTSYEVISYKASYKKVQYGLKLTQYLKKQNET